MHKRAPRRRPVRSGGTGRGMARDELCLVPKLAANARSGRRSVSSARAWDQAEVRCSGGSSRRDSRCAGRMHRGGVGRKLPWAADCFCRPASSAVILQSEPAELGATGSPDSPHGADFKQGLESAVIDSAAGSEGDVLGFVARGPQQHDA